MSNLSSLGEKQDRIDAASLLACIASTLSPSSAKPGWLTTLRRQAFDVYWEAPRRGGGPRPISVPWSPAALALYRADPRQATR